MHNDIELHVHQGNNPKLIFTDFRFVFTEGTDDKAAAAIPYISEKNCTNDRMIDIKFTMPTV